ncbi:glycosyltransferase family 4 protein [Pigmentiphaga soli]|uniref:Glycosyltransferase family 4 protein n=1 Tax=Pigmentiphaga soli TaxID=1007095 RepID=A0ABP8HN70_9BURK
MKIGIACHRFGHGGGMERYTLDVVDGLRRLGLRPVVFARAFDRDIEAYRDIDPVLIRVGALPGKLRDHVFSHRLRAIKAEYGLDALIGCSRTEVSDLAICGGTHLGHIAHRDKPAGFWDKRLIALEAAHYANARYVVAHSELMAAELRTLYAVPARRIVVLNPPVDERRFHPVDAASRLRLRHALELPDDRVVFLFASTGHERKGYPMLAASFARSRLPVLLAVAGRPIETPAPNVRYLGYRQDIENCYRAADYTILASRYEPFGLVGPESVLCGTPALLAANIGCADTLSGRAGLRFDGNDPASLEAAVERAVATVRRGEARLQDPRSHLSYNPEITAHVRALLDLAEAAAPLRQWS